MWINWEYVLCFHSTSIIRTSNARIHNIQKRMVHFIWRTISSLSSYIYFKGTIQRFLASFEVIWNTMSKKGGIRKHLHSSPGSIHASMHIFQAELHWSAIVPCRENEYVRQKQIYQENVVLLFCKSLCFSQKYLLCVVVNPFDSKWKLKKNDFM